MNAREPYKAGMLAIYRPQVPVTSTRMNRDLCYHECNIENATRVNAEKDAYKAHRLAVLNALPIINTCPPPACRSAPNIRKVKLMAEQARLKSLQCANEVIVAHLCEVMRQPTKIDNYNQYDRHVSLHMAQTFDNVARTTMDNLLMLRRIQVTKSKYPYEKFHKDWERNQKRILSIRRYKHDWRDPYYTVEALHPNGRVRCGRDAGVRVEVPTLIFNPSCELKPLREEELKSGGLLVGHE